VLSSGITELIRPVLAKLIGPAADDVEVVTNTVVPREGFDSIGDQGASWRIEFRDKSVHGHDKSAAIKPYANHVDGGEESDRPVLLYAGDGISDLSAAKETDLLYA
jgi:2-hydroxy-3-keto-5-methylthiopentenyl-1-phosphate phosphatase